MLEELSDLTIAIISYERQSFVKRQIQFWAEYPVKVIVLDGSKTAINGPEVEAFPANVIYKHSNTSLEHRYGLIGDMIATEFGMLMADDDFYSPHAIARCIREIRKDPEISACKGITIWVARSQDDGLLHAGQIYPGLRGYRVDQKTPEERVQKHFACFEMSSFWAVMPRKVFVKCMQAASAGGSFKSMGCAEIKLEMAGSWLGKNVVLDELMWFRSFENPAVWTGFKSEHKSIPQWYKEDPDEVDQLIHAVVEVLSPQEENSGKTYQVLHSALKAFVDAYYEKSSKLKNKILRIITITKINLAKIVLKIKFLKPFFLLKRKFIKRSLVYDSRPFDAFIKSLEHDGVVVYQDDIAKIKDSIRQFYQ